MQDRERIEAEGRVLFAAAQADGHVETSEVSAILAYLEQTWTHRGLAGRLPPEVLDDLAAFDSKTTTVAELARPFLGDDDRGKLDLLHLVVGVHEADGELDYEEDTFVHELGLALGLRREQFQGMLLEILDAPAPAAKKPAAKKSKKPVSKKKTKTPAPKKKNKTKKPVARKKPAARKKTRRS